MKNSGRGGARTGGGRPSEWQNQPTCTIRVPKILVKLLLEIAKELDQGLEDTVVIDPKSLSLDRQFKREHLSLGKIRIYKHSGHKVLRVEDLIWTLQGQLKR